MCRLGEAFIFFLLFYIFLSIWFVEHTPTSNFGIGFREAFTKRFDSYTYRTAGEIIEHLIICIILFLPFLISLYLRNKIVLFISQLCLVLLILYYLLLGNIPNIPLFFFFISLLKPFRQNFYSNKVDLNKKI